MPSDLTRMMTNAPNGYPHTDEQKMYQLSVNERRMKKLARRTKPIVEALDRMYRRDGFCETELLLAIQMSMNVFDHMQGDTTHLGAAFGLIQEERGAAETDQAICRNKEG